MNPRTPVEDGHGGAVSLREYIEAIMAERDKALRAAFLAQQEALNLATRNLELRLEKLNELREEVTKDRSAFMSRERYEDAHDVLENRVSSLEGFRGKALGFGALVSLISAVIGAIIVKFIGG